MSIFSYILMTYTSMLSSKYLTKDYERMHENASRHQVLTRRGMENRRRNEKSSFIFQKSYFERLFA